MKICIVGGGNIGTALAAEFARDNNDVNVLTSRPQLWNKKISAVTQYDEELFSAELNLVTDNFSKAFDSAEYIFVTLPSNVQREFVQKATPFVKAGMKFVIVPGFGGAEFIMSPIIKNGGKLFGLQRTPYVARLKKYGQRIWFDKKSAIQIAALSDKNFSAVTRDMENLFSMNVEELPNYLCVTLTPSNPVLHTSRLYTLFKNFNYENLPQENILFYADWNDAASEILFMLDAEVQQICQELSKANLSGVKSLKIHYESNTIEELTKKLRGIKSLSKILSPMKQTSKGWIPNFEDRYFTCDFGYGLDILLQFTQALNLCAPTMEKVMAWYNETTGNKNHCVNIADYGLTSEKNIYDYYQI